MKCRENIVINKQHVEKSSMQRELIKTKIKSDMDKIRSFESKILS